MAITYITGNIFNSKCQTIVNTVNCVGVMGKGIALVHRLRYPKMYEEYKDYCKRKLIKIGVLWLYTREENAPWILNFPTKLHWQYPSKIEWIERGLQKFVKTYQEKGILSIAFPLLGTHNGGLDINEVKKLMADYLDKLDIYIEIFDYEPSAKDDLFAVFKQRWLSVEEEIIIAKTGIKSQYARKISEIIQTGEINSMISLVDYYGVGEKTLEKAFAYVLNNTKRV